MAKMMFDSDQIIFYTLKGLLCTVHPCVCPVLP
jgi:hypothetical protein